MSLPLAIVHDAIPENWVSLLKGGMRIIFGSVDSDSISAEIEDQLENVQGLLCLLTTPINTTLLSKMPALRVVSNMAVGVDNIDVSACTQRGIAVGNTPGVLTDATADLAMTLLLAAARRIPEAARDAREGRWQTWSPTSWLGVDLRGAVLGIIGLGKIGRGVAERARGFGMQLVYSDVVSAPEVEMKLGIKHLPFFDLLEQSDFVTLHCPLTAETQGLINLETLRAMKRTAILINAARGLIVDSDALTHALRAGWIAGAALDVTDPEPLPAAHPLYSLRNCLILPHVGSATEGTRRRMAEVACANLLAGVEGRRLPFCVNPEVYKSSIWKMADQ